MNNYLIRKKLKNAEGKRLLEKTILEYSKDIIKYIIDKPELLMDVVEELEITEQEFYEYISGEKKGNIILYDQALCIVKRIPNENNIHKLI